MKIDEEYAIFLSLKQREGDLTPFLQLIEKRKEKEFPLDITDQNGATLLHYLSFCKKTSDCQLERVVEFLLNHSVSIDKLNSFEETALHLSIKRCNVKLVKILVAKGADISLKETSTGRKFNFLFLFLLYLFFIIFIFYLIYFLLLIYY